MVVGVAARYLPELELDGDQVFATLVRDTTLPVAARLESAVEFGGSVRYGLGEALDLMAGAGTTSERGWSGFSVTTGRTTTWSIAGAYHDPAEPWTVRLGIGQERQSGVPEPSAGLIGIGFGWRWQETGLDLGVLHRSIDRVDQPTSFDDRVVVTLGVGF
jgi:hypothetical protein